MFVCIILTCSTVRKEKILNNLFKRNYYVNVHFSKYSRKILRRKTLQIETLIKKKKVFV